MRLIGPLAAAFTLVALTSVLRAQENVPTGPSNYEDDLQIFAPYQLDLDNMSDKQWSGYFFEYNKLFWAYTGERTTIGSTNVTENINGVAVKGQFSEIIYQPNPGDFNVENFPSQIPLIENELTNVGPRAGFALGNRYELGYRDQGHGWTIGVLDGGTLNQTSTYGFTARTTDGGTPPFIPADYTDGTDVGTPTGTVGTTGPVGDARAFGFGSVPVLFESPTGYLKGFRDYVQNLAPAQAGVIGGPNLYVGSYGIPVFTEGNTITDNILVRRADDLNGNGIWGDLLVATPFGIAHVIDYGDLYTFNVYFDSVTVHSTTNVDGVELMYNQELTNQHYMAKNQNNRLTMSYGARFMRLYDDYRVDAFGSILHDAFWDTSFDNDIVGPQVEMSWVNERQRWRLESDVRFMAGLNIANWNQIGLMGAGLVPGGLNEPLFARPTAFAHGLRETEFSPVGELRLKASYHFTNSFALNMGYTGQVIGGIRRAAPSIKYYLPDLGYNDAGTQTMLTNGFDLGVEFVH